MVWMVVDYVAAQCPQEHAHFLYVEVDIHGILWHADCTDVHILQFEDTDHTSPSRRCYSIIQYINVSYQKCAIQ